MGHCKHFGVASTSPLTPTLSRKGRGGRTAPLAPLPLREREGPAPEAREGEGGVRSMSANDAAMERAREWVAPTPSPSHCCAMGPSLSRKGRGAGAVLGAMG